jgi:hypothetical protein
MGFGSNTKEAAAVPGAADADDVVAIVAFSIVRL